MSELYFPCTSFTLDQVTRASNEINEEMDDYRSSTDKWTNESEIIALRVLLMTNCCRANYWEDKYKELKTKKT